MSIFESFSDKNLITYLKYLFEKKIFNDYFDSLDFFYEDIVVRPNNISKIILAPLGKRDLNRLDIEYLYELLLNNDSKSLNEGIIYRPELQTQKIGFIREEVRYVEVYSEKTLDTYSSVNNEYLHILSDNNVIDPYEWDVETEEDLDIDVRDTRFTYY